MTPLRRWSVVLAVAVVAVGVPLAPRLLPVGDSDVSAADLLTLVDGSRGVAYSGYVETEGTVQLPVGDDLGDVGQLVAGQNRLRVWWQDDGAWRVDRLELTGEQDLVHRDDVTVSYDYEAARAEVTSDHATRLPRASDLLPPLLARTVLEDATAADVRRLPARRVGGVAAPGLRYTPSTDASTTVASTIDRVDVWADPGTGLPLRVEVRAAGDDRPAVVSAFGDVDVSRPADDRVRFRPSRGVEVERTDNVDIADAAGRYAPFRVPPQLAGLDIRTEGDVAAGVYGGGVTRFIAVPLRDREAGPLRDQLQSAPGATISQERTVVAQGALTVLLTGGSRERASWLVAGTVPPAVLEQAAAVLVDLDYVDRSGG